MAEGTAISIDPGQSPVAGDSLVFGPFRLLVSQRTLLEGERPLRLGGRAMDLLILMASRAGELLTKEELIAHVWPSTYVEESSLRVHIAALRRAMRDGRDGVRYIVNVSGRGYCFTASVSPTRDDDVKPDAAPQGRPTPRLPSRLTRTVGRSATIRSVSAQLQNHRFVTIVGFGGVGKTTVAISVAEAMGGWYQDGVHFVDLAAISSGQQVPSAIGTVAGLSVPSSDPVGSLVRFLSGRHVLLVLDSCEHLVDTVATVAEQILKGAPRVHVLATSREPLSAEGERLLHLSPLELPAAHVVLTADTALTYAAVQLFVEHASASQDSFQLNDADAVVVGDICRRLDGIPLAIELAANRVDMFGIRGLAGRLNDRFLLLTQGRRTALPRHRTLGAMLDWSYELLPATSQVVFRRLAAFRGSFTMEAAIAVTGDGELGEHEVMDSIMVLAAGSLLSTDISGEVAHYSLLGVTRAYAAMKLGAHEDLEALRRRHAQYLLHLFQVAREEWDTRDRPSWLAIYGRTIDDLRAALDWAFGDGGDPALGVVLTAAWMPLGMTMSLLDEFRERVEVAISWLDVVKPEDPAIEMQLRSTLASFYGQTRGDSEAVVRGFERVIELAEATNIVSYKHDALLGMWVVNFGAGSYVEAGRYADRLRESAELHNDPMGRLTASRMKAQVRHFLGDHAGARALAREVMGIPGGPIRMPLMSPVQVDRRVSMRIILARCLWLQGMVDQAAEVVQEAWEFARKDLAHSSCQLAAMAAIPISLWRGDHGTAAEQAEFLLSHATQYTMGYWQAWAHHYRYVLLERGAAIHGDARTEALLPPMGAKHLDHLITCSPAYVTREAVARVRSGVVGWCAPEVLRAQGEVLLAHDDRNDRATAEALFAEAIALARSQKAFSWELRAATSMARLLADDHRRTAADMLDAMLNQVHEGHRTADVTTARQLLASLDG